MGKENYDIFISFKNSDENGNDTLDKAVAQRVYDYLQNRGLKVFFSPVTLKELGRDAWGAEINQALITSKVFIALGTQKSYMEATWTQKERTSFLALKLKDDSLALYSYLASPMTTADLPEDIKGYEAFQDTKAGELERLYTYIANHLSFKPIVAIDHDFLQEVFDGLEREKLVVLFSQEFTKIDDYYHHIKREAQRRFGDAFYRVSVPAATDNHERYFGAIAQCCGIQHTVRDIQDWKEAMQKRLKASSEELLLFITDIEDGNTQLDRQFATVLRTLKREFPHFHALLIGRKGLARLVYEEGELSPLNTAKRLFFPDSTMLLGEEQIAFIFHRLGKDRAELCKLLAKEQLGRHTFWSFNDLINRLFWMNLLVNEKGYFVWRGKLTCQIGREVLECEGDVV